MIRSIDKDDERPNLNKFAFREHLQTFGFNFNVEVDKRFSVEVKVIVCCRR